MAEWEKWTKPGSKVEQDKKGPDGALRCRVTVRDLVVYRDETGSERQVKAEKKAHKNATQEKLDELTKAVLTGHSQLSSSSSFQDRHPLRSLQNHPS